ncbi:kynureninase [Cryomorpha ignava]|uniref:Kynureninase n=1 Tax=Cryomorpha ignava TaxID=101383 RepID=A0A7K3WNU0_9FLAO|nr:kynureninase [Cryomorpha ignava]NEN23320.1 kynureninase [Cryomorpha ignava]
MQEYKEEAKNHDAQDALADFRNSFYFPETEADHCVYFTGNSLGLQPKTVRDEIDIELRDWAKYGVEGHFEAEHPWFSYHELLMEPAAKMVGALPGEVVHMNGLTTNIHLLMVSFYSPTKHRYKIICEAKAFPSDQYALESQVLFHGFNPHDAIVEVHPRKGEHTIRQEDIEAAIEEHKDELALVFWGGVNYYTGQLFDMKGITEAAHAQGAVVGFDLAHAAGNVPLELHNWDVDFAAWCTYKYFNSGPGSVGGVFVHHKHANTKNLPRFAGWWGYNKEKRFKMESGFDPIPGAEGWQLSNAPVFAMAPHLASLKIFEKAGMDRLRAKSVKLTAFLERIINHVAEKNTAEIELITPSDPDARGAQLSILAHGYGKGLFHDIQKNGVFADWREPNVIRIAPVPLYNSFYDCYKFGELLDNALKKYKK